MATAGDNIHISAPELLSRRRRMGDAFITALMWFLYSYLWAPFISLVAWLLGFEFAYDVMMRAGGIHALKEVMWWYMVIVLCIIVIVATWSIVNRQRFAGHDRRRSGHHVTDDELARYFALSMEDFGRLQSAQSLRIALAESGAVERIDAIEAGELSDGGAARTPDRR